MFVDEGSGPVEICPADEKTGRREATVAYIRNDHLTVQNRTLGEELRPMQEVRALGGRFGFPGRWRRLI